MQAQQGCSSNLSHILDPGTQQPNSVIFSKTDTGIPIWAEVVRGGSQRVIDRKPNQLTRHPFLITMTCSSGQKRGNGKPRKPNRFRETSSSLHKELQWSEKEKTKALYRIGENFWQEYEIKMRRNSNSPPHFNLPPLTLANPS